MPSTKKLPGSPERKNYYLPRAHHEWFAGSDNASAYLRDLAETAITRYFQAVQALTHWTPATVRAALSHINKTDNLHGDDWRISGAAWGKVSGRLTVHLSDEEKATLDAADGAERYAARVIAFETRRHNRTAAPQVSQLADRFHDAAEAADSFLANPETEKVTTKAARARVKEAADELAKALTALS